MINLLLKAVGHLVFHLTPSLLNEVLGSVKGLEVNAGNVRKEGKK